MNHIIPIKYEEEGNTYLAFILKEFSKEIPKEIAPSDLMDALSDIHGNEIFPLDINKAASKVFPEHIYLESREKKLVWEILKKPKNRTHQDARVSWLQSTKLPQIDVDIWTKKIQTFLEGFNLKIVGRVIVPL